MPLERLRSDVLHSETVKHKLLLLERCGLGALGAVHERTATRPFHEATFHTVMDIQLPHTSDTDAPVQFLCRMVRPIRTLFIDALLADQ
jgi:hypothetical protein